jgi:hypothetical protein
MLTCTVLRVAASVYSVEIGWRLRRTTKLRFRKLNSISSKQLARNRDRGGGRRSKHYILFSRASERGEGSFTRGTCRNAGF